jgi:hypothetical protein
MNAIAHHNQYVRASLPKGAGQKSNKSWSLFKCIDRPTYEGQSYEGLSLVRWLISQNLKEEARVLLADIKAGRVSP